LSRINASSNAGDDPPLGTKQQIHVLDRLIRGGSPVGIRACERNAWIVKQDRKLALELSRHPNIVGVQESHNIELRRLNTGVSGIGRIPDMGQLQNPNAITTATCYLTRGIGRSVIADDHLSGFCLTQGAFYRRPDEARRIERRNHHAHRTSSVQPIRSDIAGW
jgi:hypothetical protein